MPIPLSRMQPLAAPRAGGAVTNKLIVERRKNIPPEHAEIERRQCTK